MNGVDGKRGIAYGPYDSSQSDGLALPVCRFPQQQNSHTPVYEQVDAAEGRQRSATPGKDRARSGEGGVEIGAANRLSTAASGRAGESDRRGMRGGESEKR